MTAVRWLVARAPVRGRAGRGGAWVRDEAGFATVTFVVAVALSLLMFTLVANVVVVQYGRGVLRMALDEGVRAGARIPDDAGLAVAACQRRVEEVRGNLLGGALGDGVEVGCGYDGARVTATADGAFPAWLPGVPASPVSARAGVRHETVP